MKRTSNNNPLDMRISVLTRKRPLVISGVVLLALMLTASTAYALGILFMKIFGAAKDDLEAHSYDLVEREQYWDENLQQANIEEYLGQEDLLELTPQEQRRVAIDMITDFEATTSGAIYGTLLEMQKCLGIVGTEDRGIILSEIALLISRPRLLFIGVYSDRSNVDLKAIKPIIRIDGHDQEPAVYFDYSEGEINNNGTDTVAIYETRIIKPMEYMPNTSLLEVSLGNSTHVFEYNWATQTATVPADQAEKEEMLTRSIQLYNGIDHEAHCFSLPAAYIGKEFDIHPTSFYMKGFNVYFTCDLIVKDDTVDRIHPYVTLKNAEQIYRGAEEPIELTHLYDRSMEFMVGKYTIGWCWQIPVHYEEIQTPDFSVEIIIGSKTYVFH